VFGEGVRFAARVGGVELVVGNAAGGGERWVWEGEAHPHVARPFVTTFAVERIVATGMVRNDGGEGGVAIRSVAAEYAVGVGAPLKILSFGSEGNDWLSLSISVKDAEGGVKRAAVEAVVRQTILALGADVAEDWAHAIADFG
jgi:hypothetical protein